MNSKLKAIAGLTALGSACLVDASFAAPQTFTGTTQYNPRGGSVQVQITVDNGKITGITTPVQPGGGNQWYSNYAIPTLTTRALNAQSATIQGVSGASQVSTAWKASLASAISQAGSAITGGSGTPATSAPVPVQTQSTQTIPNNSGNNSGTNAGGRLPRPGHVENHGSIPQQGGEGNEGVEHEGGDDDGYVVVRPRTVPTPAATAKSTITSPVPAATQPPVAKNDLGLVPKAGVIQKTITCVKGAVKKTVKGKNPKCPTGYTLKKP
jgi:hypothetical protein